LRLPNWFALCSNHAIGSSSRYDNLSNSLWRQSFTILFLFSLLPYSCYKFTYNICFKQSVLNFIHSLNHIELQRQMVGQMVYHFFNSNLQIKQLWPNYHTQHNDNLLLTHNMYITQILKSYPILNNFVKFFYIHNSITLT